MNPSQVADKYTQALRAAISGEDELRRAGRAYRQFTILCDAEPVLMRLWRNPTVPLSVRKSVLTAVLELCEAPEAVAGLAHLLLERNRLGLLPLIVTQFERQVDAWLNRVEVTTYSALPLTEESRVKLQKSLELFTSRSVRMHCIADPGIIGGLIVNMYGFSFDFSYRTRLERLRQKLLLEETLVYGD
jgi:ATP synthase F1 delta subunit